MPSVDADAAVAGVVVVAAVASTESVVVAEVVVEWTNVCWVCFAAISDES